MTEKRLDPLLAFRSADKILKEDGDKSENRRRFDRWVDVMIRERKLDPEWKKDPAADEKLKQLKTGETRE